MADPPRLIASCPSCGADMDAVPEDHVLTIESGRTYERAPLLDRPPSAECNYGDPVDATDLLAAWS